MALQELRMAKRLRYGLIVLAVVSMAHAADVTVRVTDTHKDAIPAANIYLISRDGERQVLTTGATGSCLFRAVAAGEDFVQAEAAGLVGSAVRPRGPERHAGGRVSPFSRTRGRGRAVVAVA